jgi:hypothetical protein
MAGKGRAQGGNSGGVRPGSGRKRQETVVAQASRRGAVLDVISDEVWREMLTEWIKLGRTVPQVIFPLLPYLLGGVKQEIDVNARIEQVRITEIRQALGIVEIGPKALNEASGE